MSNIINFPGRASTRANPFETNDLVEAFGLALIFLRDWEETTRLIGDGALVLVGENLLPFGEVYSPEPIIRFCGEEKAVAEIVSLANAMIGERPLPVLLDALLHVWSPCDEPYEQPTFAEAADILSFVIDEIRVAQKNPPRKRAEGGR